MMQDRHAAGVFLGVRIVSVFLITTWFVPDEYWQSLEVAHKFVFGYGHLTWEWAKGIRSYVHPGIFTVLYKILQLLGVDSPEVLIIAPRLLQAIFSAYADYSFWRWSGRTKWSMFLILVSWFWYYTATRTLLNTFEACLTTIALSKFPFRNKTVQEKNKEDDYTFLWIAGLIVAIRPTAALLWIPMCLYQIFTCRVPYLSMLLHSYLPIILTVAVGSVIFDSVMHGAFVVTWYEFFVVNVWEGIGEFYGSHPWHWYLSVGFATILGVNVIPFLCASVRILQHRHIFVDELALLASITFTIFTLSFLGHKEFRFLLPILPIAMHITADFLTTWSRKAANWFVWVAAVFLLVGNAGPAIYFGAMHQRGNIDVMQPLRDIASQDASASFLFLMPCHSTPLYSHLHHNVSARFLTCQPNLSGAPDYVDEATFFYDAPTAWIGNNLRVRADRPLPSHLVTFDVLVPHISDLLSRYKPIHRIFNTQYVSDARVGRFVIVHELIDRKKPDAEAPAKEAVH